MAILSRFPFLIMIVMMKLKIESNKEKVVATILNDVQVTAEKQLDRLLWLLEG